MGSLDNEYRPLPSGLYVGWSDIEGQGLRASVNIPAGTDLGVSHFRRWFRLERTPLGGWINHSTNPSCTKRRSGFMFRKYRLVTLRNIERGEELTLTYTLVPAPDSERPSV